MIKISTTLTDGRADCIPEPEKSQRRPGDVPATYADVDDLIRDVGFKPATSIETGVANFVKWYRDYYNC